MITQAKLTKESFQIGANYSAPQSTKCNVFYMEFSAAIPAPIKNTVTVDELIQQVSQDPEMDILLAKARQSLSQTVYHDKQETLAAIRLASGLSQKLLADKLGTSQPYIARLESGETDPGTDTIANLAAALHCDETKIFNAIRKQRKAR